MNGQDDTNAGKAPRLGTARIMLVLLIIAAAVEMITVLSWYLNPQSYDSGYDYDEYLSGADASVRGGIEYLTDEEVMDIGLPCTELGHFDFSGDLILDDILAVIEDEGFGINDTETSSYNQIYGDGGSWYETLLTYYLMIPGDDTGYQRITLNYDTATGALHEIDLFLSDEDTLFDFCDAVLRLLSEHSGAYDDSVRAEAVQDLERNVWRHENMYAVYTFAGTGNIAVTLYCFDDGYSVYIGREQTDGQLE